MNDKILSESENITEMTKSVFLESIKNDEFLARIYDPEYESENEEKENDDDKKDEKDENEKNKKNQEKEKSDDGEFKYENLDNLENYQK